MFAVILLALLISVPVRADLRDTDNSADYIILTNQEVLYNNAWIGDLLAYREAQGRTAMAVTVEEIWDEFTPSDENGIRDFLHYAYDHWQAPRLKDVFIVGHWDVVPCPTFESLNDSAVVNSDFLFTVPQGSDDYAPRFAVGRLPWSPRFNVALNDFAAKIGHYEGSPTGEWLNRCHLIADSVCGFVDCDIWIEDAFAEQLPASLNIERDYLMRPEGDDWHGDCDEVFANLDSGALFTSIYSMSSAYDVLLPCQLDANAVAGLLNYDALTILFATVSFALGADSSDQVPVQLAGLNNEGGGLIAGLAHSAVGWAMSSGVFNRMMVTKLANSDVPTIGEAWLRTCDSLVEAGNQGVMFENVQMTFLLGDPATIIPGRGTAADPIGAPQIPATIQIVGNYPNPFNPTTTVSFLLNRAGNAKLAVFDITGRTVATLADRDFTAGQHNLVWDATGLASGMYLVRLEAAGQFDTHRITLLK